MKPDHCAKGVPFSSANQGIPQGILWRAVAALCDVSFAGTVASVAGLRQFTLRFEPQLPAGGINVVAFLAAERGGDALFL